MSATSTPVTPGSALDSSEFESLIAMLPSNTILTSSTQQDLFKNAMRWSHLMTVPWNVQDMNAYFAGTPIASTNDNASFASIANGVVGSERYRAPSSVQSTVALHAPVLDMLFTLCRRAVVQHLGCRLGGEQVNGVCVRDFDSNTRNACNMHVSAIGQTILSRIPFPDDGRMGRVDGTEPGTHLFACRVEIKHYIDAARAQSQQNRGTWQGAAGSASIIAPMVSTSAIFNTETVPSQEAIIYNCMLPWLQLLFVTSFIDRRDVMFTMFWRASYITHLFGYFAAKDCYAAMSAAIPTLPTSLQTMYRSRRDEYTKMMRYTANVIYIMGQMKEIFQMVGSMNQFIALGNTAGSVELQQAGDALDFKRRSMEVLGTYYLSNKKAAQASRSWMLAVAITYAILTLLLVILVIPESTCLYAILISGVVMLGIIVYTLASVLRNTTAGKLA